MCYHISFEIKLENILDYFPDLIIDPQLELDFPTSAYINGFDHRPQQVMVRSRKDGKRHLALMNWGYLPNSVENWEAAERFWNGYKDENGIWHKGFITLNAVGEELFLPGKKLFQEAALTRRCIVFSDGIYEWQHVFPLGKKGQPLKTAVKYPHHISLKDAETPFIMMAGIWTPWHHTEVNKETGEIQKFVTPTFAIVTTEANSLMAKIHNSKKRMPTILTKELAEEWVTDGLSEERILEIAGFQYPAEQMDAYSIPKDFQQIDNPRIHEDYPELQVIC